MPSTMNEFVQQIARMTLPAEEFAASETLQNDYKSADDYEDDLDDDYLLSQHAALKALILQALELLV